MSKDKRWVNPSDPGILRKKADAETDLFVFGYSCKIFRDDQKALEMDQGKQLIPWMGDDTLKIDRYDARGHLSELSQFEGTNQDYVLTPEEKRIEQLCDEERYRALHQNEEEQEMYQEEELKRLKQALSSDKEYGQVAYQYDTDASQPSNTEPEQSAEDQEPFIPSPLLDIPSNMQVPSTVKENQIIEKTAAHIASHGPQVEILIKTRQANNQKLSFLHVGSPLNSYYNFILAQIKAGRYKPGFMTQQETQSNQENDHYLHPSLAPATSATVESAPSIPSIAYKPSSDCFYNLLVNKIRNMQQNQVEGARREEPSTSGDSPPSRRKRRRRYLSPSQAQPTTPVLKQELVPPQHVKEIIARLINFAHSRELHPSEIAANLLKQDYKNLGFVEPGHKYHDYYVQQLQETYKENIYNFANPSMEVADDEHLNDFDPLNTYDPEMPTEEEFDPSPSENTNSPILQMSSKSAVSEPTRGNNQSNRQNSPVAATVTSSEYDVPNLQPSKPAPVCFSIKKPKETEKLEHVSAFPLEESSSDGEGKDKEVVSKYSEEEKQKPAEGIKQQSSFVTDTEEKVKTSRGKDQSRKRGKHSVDDPKSLVEHPVLSPSKVSRRKSRERHKIRRHDIKHKNSSSSSGPNSKEKRRKTYHTSKDHGRKTKERSREQERERSKSYEEKDKKDSVTKSRRETDDLPPLLEDPVLSPPVLRVGNLEKKREERKKRVKQMIEKIKTKSLSVREDKNEGSFQVSSRTVSTPTSECPIISSGTFLPHGPTSLLLQKSVIKTEESKKDSQKDIEEQLREQVKQSLKKIAETTLASLPPITEDSSSQLDHSSAANSNGFETPSSCGRPMYRVSRTPSVGFVEGTVQEYSGSWSSSSASSPNCSREKSITPEKSRKKKKHHKKHKKRKAHSKARKRHESSSDSSSEEESNDTWLSSSDSEPTPKKRHHKKSSKRSHKRHKRRHRRRRSSSSS